MTDSGIQGAQIRITGSDAAHIMRSLRMKSGEKVTVCDMHMTEYDCVIADFGDNDVILDIISSHKGNTEPPYRIVLYQALPKSDKMEFIIQKSVEAGVSRVVPFISERCISRPDKKSSKSKVERWNKIALEAAKQCGRGIIPCVEDILTYNDVLKDAEKSRIKILFYEGDNTVSLKKVLSDIETDVKKELTIAIIIGAEGGFSIDEVAKAADMGFTPAGLGPRILRCETAPIVALGAISYALEL